MENKQKTIEKFDVKSYNYKSSLLGYSVCPEEFTAKIDKDATMEDLVHKLSETYIPSSDGHVRHALKRDDVWTSFSDLDIRLGDYKLGENTAGFILINEYNVMGGGMNIKEGVYAIRKEADTLRGKLLSFDMVSPREKNQFRHLLGGIEDNVLKYTYTRYQEAFDINDAMGFGKFEGGWIDSERTFDFQDLQIVNSQGDK